jgi:hypothetical protein
MQEMVHECQKNCHIYVDTRNRLGKLIAEQMLRV